MPYSSFEKNIEDMGLLAKFVYAQNFSQLEKNLPNTYKVEYFNSNYSSGFAGALLRDKNSGNYIIAFRGTDELVDSLSWIGENTPQYQDAKNFVFDMIIKYGIDKSNLTITGHSLGGILTAQIASELHLKGYAYNPFGANLLSYKRYKKYANVINDWANKNIYTISYQDEGLINGDILSNLITNLIGSHLGKFIPILGKNVGLDGHDIDALNNAIKEHKDII